MGALGKIRKGSTQSSLFVSPTLNTTYWLTQYSNGFSCADTIFIA